MANKFGGFSGKEFENLRKIREINNKYSPSFERYSKEDYYKTTDLIHEVQVSLKLLAKELLPSIKSVYPHISYQIEKINVQGKEVRKEDLRLSFAESKTSGKGHQYVPHLKVEVLETGLRVTAHLQGTSDLKPFRENLKKRYDKKIISEIHFRFHEGEKLTDGDEALCRKGVQGYSAKDFSLQLGVSGNYFGIGKFIDRINPIVRTPEIADDILNIFEMVYPAYDFMMGREAKLSEFPKPIEFAPEENRKKRFARMREDLKTSDKEVLEGVERVEETTILRRSRNRDIVDKQKVRRHYTCEVCGWNFGGIYGEAGKDFIIGHHKDPIHMGERTSIPDNINVLCANCHYMCHYGRKPDNPRTTEELKSLIKKATGGTITLHVKDDK